MADESVCFSGSSAEEIEQAKIFWQAIYPLHKPTSALIVAGIDHRLRTAPNPQNRVNYAHQSIEELIANEMDPALQRFKDDSEKQRVLEDTEYKDKMLEFKKESQDLIQRRKEERIKKEKISSRVLQKKHDQLMYNSDSEEDDEDARQAMDDIEKFEARLRQQEKIKPT